MAGRLAAALAALACVASLAGCGGGEAEPDRRAEPPKIPSALANELAERSDAVAAKLEAGDTCGAAVEADALEDRVEALIAAGEIPQRYRAELRSEAVWLQDKVNCPDPPAPPAPEEDEDDDEGEDDKGKGKDDKGKGKGEGEGDGDDSVTLTVETGVTLEDGG